MADGSDRQKLLSYMEGRFGLPAVTFDGYLLFHRGESWWLLRKSPYLQLTSGLKVGMIGLRAFQRVGRYVKPSTRMIQVFGGAATKGKFELVEEEFQRLVAGDPIKADLKLENGYLILSLKGHILGLGLLIDGEVRSQMPRKELRSPSHMPRN
ncbi:MAG: hypothetical protein MUO52_16105 [Desulfobacterales bacterium]|nr:hypothetical protein [Desulfobacterales bacterium]